MLTKEKKAVLLFALFVVVGMMITIPNGFASTSSDVFIVSSNSGAEAKTMELRAIKESGEARKVSTFAISIENVVSVQRDGKVTVFSAPTSPTFTSAKITDINDNTVDIPITDTGVISLAGYSEGVYTLDVIVDDRFAFECILVIGPQEVQQQIINKQITEVNQETDVNIIKKKFERKGIDKEKVCLYTPNHPICKPVKGKCPKGWAMNAYGQCYPYKLPCPKGYWRADYDESGACVKKPVVCIQIYPPPLGCLVQKTASVNGTSGGNLTSAIGKANNTGADTTSQPNATDTTPPGISPINETQSDGGDGGGGINATEPEELAFRSGPPVECGEGEQLAPDGLSCEPISPGPPQECPEGQQLSPDGLGCEPIAAEEPTPVECGEGEELIDGQCQAIPTEELASEEEPEEETEEEPEEETEEEPEEETEESGGGDEGGDAGGDEEGASE